MDRITEGLVNLTPDRRDRRVLLCLPYAGGGVSAFHDWPDRLPDLDVWAVRPPGRESRFVEPAFTDLAALVTSLVPGAVRLTRRPYAVVGHSMGALVGYELVRALRAAGLPEPFRFVASGHEAPHRADHSEQLHRLPDERLVARLRDYGATPESVLASPELMELFLPTVRADFAAVETYEYRPGLPLSCEFSVLRGASDADVRDDACRAWGELTLGGCTTHTFPGGHFFLESEVTDVLATLAGLLAAPPAERTAA